MISAMTNRDRDSRTVGSRAERACRRAGLPVVAEHECSCALRGRLVIVAGAHGLGVGWPYAWRCPIHSGHDAESREGCAPSPDSRLRPRAVQAGQPMQTGTK